MKKNVKLNQKIQEFLIIKQQIDKLTAKQKAIRTEVKFYLDEEGVVDYIDENGNKVTYREQVTNRLDTAKIKEFLGNNLSEYQKATTSEVLKIISKESAAVMKGYLDTKK